MGFRLRNKLRKSKQPWTIERPRTTYGMWHYHRKGSMAQGSNILTLTFPSTFAVGDWIIVETGGEAGAGARGTVGVGGSLPIWTAAPGYWYFDVINPKALCAVVTAVSPDGLTITLNKTAAVATSNANVYFDNWKVMQLQADNSNLASEIGLPVGTPNPHPPGWTITWPAGTFAMSRAWEHAYSSGWIVKGQGIDVTIFVQPNGAPNIGFGCFEADAMEFGDFTVLANCRSTGGYMVQEVGDINAGGYMKSSFGVICSLSENCIVENIRTKDVWRKAVWGEYAGNLQASGVTCEMTTPFRVYWEWWIGCSDSDNCTFTDCHLTASHAQPGFECFRSNNSQFIDCTSVNGVFSNNSSGNWVLTNFEITMTANCIYQDGQPEFPGSGTGDFQFHHNNPIINLNSNIQPPSGALLLGGIINNITIHVLGVSNTNGNLMKGINVDAPCPNITVNGGLITYAGNRGPTANVGPYGVNSTASLTIVNDVVVTGAIALEVDEEPAVPPGPYLLWFEGDIALALADNQANNCTAARIYINGVEQP